MPKPVPFTLQGKPRSDDFYLMLHGTAVEDIYFNLRGYRGGIPGPDGLELDIGEKPISAYKTAIRQANKEWAGIQTWYEFVSPSERRVYGTNYERAVQRLKDFRSEQINQGREDGTWHAAVVEVTLRGTQRFERDVMSYQGKASTYHPRLGGQLIPPQSPQRWSF